MNFEIRYHELVIKEDIPKLATQSREQVKKAIEKKLFDSPEKFGKPLRRSLKGYRKLRVGDFRIVFRIEDKTVKILAILHRSVVYKNVKKRI